jgi:hypothetical protein
MNRHSIEGRVIGFVEREEARVLDAVAREKQCLDSVSITHPRLSFAGAGGEASDQVWS